MWFFWSKHRLASDKMVPIVSESLSEPFIFKLGQVQWTFLASKRPPDLCFICLRPE